MSLLKLGKLLYFAQGWHLGLHGTPLFDDPVLAWREGPVVSEVLQALWDIRDRDIARTGWRCEAGHLVPDADRAFLDRIFDEYADEDSQTLVGRARSTDPWLDAWGSPFHRVIPQEAMRGFFGSAA
jgi:uncharacterized phage-associated protein